MNQGICYIIGAGECSRLLLQLKDEDFVIAVDGGYEYVKENRIDLVVGDLIRLVMCQSILRLFHYHRKRTTRICWWLLKKA